jgi:hypothetical protein
MTCLQSVEKSAESLRSISKNGAGEGIESPLLNQHSTLSKRFRHFHRRKRTVNGLL